MYRLIDQLIFAATTWMAGRKGSGSEGKKQFLAEWSFCETISFQTQNGRKKNAVTTKCATSVTKYSAPASHSEVPVYFFFQEEIRTQA